MVNTNREFYVYVMFRPWDGTPCYVGKGSGRRYAAHFRKKHCNSRLGAIINKAGGKIPVVIIRKYLTEKEAYETEIALIKVLGKGKFGLLANLTDGGEGGSNPSSETRLKLSIKSKQQKASDEKRAKLSLATKAAWQDPEKRARMHSSLLKDGMKDKLASNRGKTTPIEVRKKISAASSKNASRPEFRAKLSESLKQYFASKKVA